MRGPLKVAAGLIAVATFLPVVATTPAQAAGSVRSAVSLTGPAAGNYGARVALTGKLWRYGTRTVISGQPVVLQRSVHGRNVWGNLTSTRTSSTGTFAFGITLNGVYDYRTVYAGSATYTSAVSGTVFPAVRRAVFFDSIKTTDPGYDDSGAGIVKASGRAYPVLPEGVPVYLQRYNAGNRTWSSIGVTRANGSASFAVSGRVRGSIAYYRLQVAARAPYYPGTSRHVRFAHYVWRGVYHRPVLTSGGYLQPWYRTIPVTSQNPYRSSAEIGADRGGNSWVDVNTTGCVRMHHRGLNQTDDFANPTRLRVGVLGRGTFLRYIDLQPGETVWMRSIPLNGLTRTRVQVWDLGRSGPPQAWNVTWVLCNN
jgi:hypothetical protein